ncbi:hypothetical protein [Pseudomonas silesiensis]|jgi:hypothetical protein
MQARSIDGSLLAYTAWKLPEQLAFGRKALSHPGYGLGLFQKRRNEKALNDQGFFVYMWR